MDNMHKAFDMIIYAPIHKKWLCEQADVLTGLSVNGKESLSVQDAVNYPSAASIGRVIGVRGHNLHHWRPCIQHINCFKLDCCFIK